MKRCDWCGDDPLYVKYHDEEWGRVITDDRTLFEFLTLESAQAGLSWITILRKREGYRKAFLNFDFEKVAEMTDDDEERLYRYDGIVRNRRKIHAAITNARLFSDIIAEYGSFYKYIISFFPERKRVVNHVPDMSSLPVSSPVSDKISRDMYRRGFRFFGTVICYSFLQATGFIDDHLNDCHCKIMTQINIDKIHTTQLGEERITKNLHIGRTEIISYCRKMILDNSSVISRKGKNWYITNGNVTLTVNAGSHTIITAHKISG